MAPTATGRDPAIHHKETVRGTRIVRESDLPTAPKHGVTFNNTGAMTRARRILKIHESAEIARLDGENRQVPRRWRHC